MEKKSAQAKQCRTNGNAAVAALRAGALDPADEAAEAACGVASHARCARRRSIARGGGRGAARGCARGEGGCAEDARARARRRRGVTRVTCALRVRHSSSAPSGNVLIAASVRCAFTD